MTDKAPHPRPERPKNSVVVGAKGRIVIPHQIRRELGIDQGDVLTMRVSDGHIVLETRASLIKRIQDKYLMVAPEVSLSDELLTERRLEANREAEEVRRGRSRD